MSRRQSEANRYKKKKWRIILASVVFVYIFFRSVPSLFAVRSKTVLPESSLVEDKLPAEAIIIRREYLYKANGDGKIQVLTEEGERIAAGTKIARLTLLKDDSTLNKDLEEIDSKIDTLTDIEKDGDIAKNDRNKIKGNMEDIIYEIQQSISNGEYEKVTFLKDKLSIYDGKQKDISGENTLIDQSLDSLKDRRQEMVEQISSNSKDYFSQEPGIVSFKIDGYEELYSFNHKEEYDFSDFDKIDMKQKTIEDKDDVKTGEPIFKVMDNFQWYMIINIEDMNNIGSIEEGSAISIAGDEAGDSIHGYVEKISREKDRGLILCKFNTDFEKYYDKRYMEIDIVKHSQEGYKIPTKSIVEKDGMKGVYIKNTNGIIKFKPVKVITEEDKVTYVERGDKNNNIQIEGYDQPFKTITAFDEIYSNTINIKEGMVIN